MKNFAHILTLLLLFTINVNSQTTASNQVSTFIIEAPQLTTHKKIWVYLPKSYKTSNKSYPVIYMHDAQNLFDAETSYAGEWKVDEYLDTISNNEVIIVGIEHGNEKRADELTPFKNQKYGGGQGDLYLTFIKNTLKPHIDITYRTFKDKTNTTIFGSSLGGLISFYAVIKYPETFGSAGVFSPSFWFNKEIFEFVKTSNINPITKFYFLVGSKERDSTVQDQNKMVTLLKDKGVLDKHIINNIIKGGKHNEAFWSSYFPEAHQWLFQD
ncbi:MAG: alpha/beta hydrolase [Bacteroidetes bacterium]|nr:MAG: alpha/beta hydrolase [Bacteroidota bacterium]